MRGTTLAAALVLAITPAFAPVLGQPAHAQSPGQTGPISGAPAGASAPAPDLATYGQLLQNSVNKLHTVMTRPSAQNAPAGGTDERPAHQEVERAVTEALGVVRRAPTAYRDQQDYKDAESQVAAITRRIQGQHEPASLTEPVQQIIQTMDALHAKVVAAASRH